MVERIAVLGAGVIGRSTAVRLAEAGKRVTLISGQPADETTSATAAAYWAPYWIGDYNHQWASVTLAHLRQCAATPGTGVTIQRAEEWLDADGARELDADLDHSYWWRELPGIRWKRETLATPRTMRLPGATQTTIQFIQRVSFHTAVARMPDYLEYLLRRFLELPGARYEQRWVDSLGSLLPDFDRVINCTGWQAVHLVDQERHETEGMRLLAGHVAVLPAVEGLPLVSLHHGAFRELSLYIVPRVGSARDIICGGTAIATAPPERSAILRGDEQLCEAILERCVAFEPRLAGSPPLGRLMGLRPVRKAVRIEPDGDDARIIHCYGHGGSGLTLSWGSAEEVLRLLRNETSTRSDRGG